MAASDVSDSVSCAVGDEVSADGCDSSGDEVDAWAIGASLVTVDCA